MGGTRSWNQIAKVREWSGRCPNCREVVAKGIWLGNREHDDGDGGFVCHRVPPCDNELWASDKRAEDCDHWYGLTGVHGLVFSYCMCWWCDLKWRAGWRWQFGSMGPIIEAFKAGHPELERAC